MLRNIAAVITGVLSIASGIANALMLATPLWTCIEMPLDILEARLAGRMAVARQSK